MGSARLANPTIQEWFDPSAFVEPTPNTFGNAGRNTLYGPRYFDLDLSLAKEFVIPIHGEGVRLQLRADAFNAFNHPNFGQPNASIGVPGAGEIFSASAARNVQVEARINF